MNAKEKVDIIISTLEKLYPNPTTALTHKNPLQLLFATILSAQATDKLVNSVTPALFEKYKTAKDFAHADYEELDSYLKKVNFHRNKAKAIIAAAKIIDEKYNGKVPDTMEELILLPGVARKTANVVLGTAFGKNAGIAVDTHVMRLSQKFGLTTHNKPEKIEQDLMKLVPQDKWTKFSHLLILYGREYCPTRLHNEENCPLSNLLIS